MLEFLVFITCAGEIQNDFCLVHYTYFMELSSICGLNVWLVKDVTFSFHKFTDLKTKFTPGKCGFDAQSCFYCLL